MVLLEAEHIGIEGKGFPLVVYEYAGQVDSDAAPFSMAGRLAVGNQAPQPLSESKNPAHIGTYERPAAPHTVPGMGGF